MTENERYAKRWLMVGVVALALGGLLAVVLVVARTPQLAALTLFKDLFGKSLVIHVDLTVLVWFLAAGGMMWNLTRHTEQRGWLCLPLMRGAANGIFLAGTVLMACSLLMGGEALKNNYIPVLTNIGFILSLGLILAGIALGAIETLGRLRLADVTGEFGLHNFAIVSSVPIVLVMLLCFYLSAAGVHGRVEGEQFYEIVFWGGGHALQFLYVQVMMVAWLWLAQANGMLLPVKPLWAVFGIGPVIAVLSSPAAYLLYDVTSYEYLRYFTLQMYIGLGIAPVVMVLMLLCAALRVKPLYMRSQRALFSALAMSLVLFGFGGIFAMLIEGQNVMIPAHYHGSIVGVTLALMGAGYLLLPRFGGAPVAEWRMAFWQPIIYGVGQIMHISGLAWSGGYEVMRKTPGEVTDAARAAMGFMGLGGLLAIIGGILFVVVVIRSLKSNHELPTKR